MTGPHPPHEVDADPTPIHRILYTHPTVLIYAVPPLRPGAKGYSSRQWSAQAPIFTARLEIVETTSTPSTSTPSLNSDADPTPTTTITLRLLDPQSGELFAAAPYTHPSIVTPCIDSGRFFAARVADESGRKATLGVGFEEREGAFEFLEGLGRAGKMLGFARGEGLGRLGGNAGGHEKGRDDTGVARVVRDMSTIENGKVTRDDSNLFAIAPPPPPAGGATAAPNAASDGDAVELTSRVAVNDEPPDLDADDDFGDFQ